MRCFLIVVIWLAGVVAAEAQNDFRSRQSGNWNASTTWEEFVAGSWQLTSNTPTSADGATTIQTTHTVTVTAPVTIDQTTVDVGGTLQVNTTITLTVADGAGDDLVATGTLAMVAESILSGAGNLVVNGTLRVGSQGGVGAVVTGTTSGNIRISGATTYSSSATISYTSAGIQFIGSGHPTTSGVTTVINNAGTSFNTNTSGNASATELLIPGNLVLTAGNLAISSSGPSPRMLTISADITANSNGIAVGGPTTDIVVNGTGAFGTFPFTAGAKSFRALTINRGGGGTVSFSNVITVNGLFTLSAGTADFNAATTLSGAATLAAGTTLSFEGVSLTLAGNHTSAGGVLSSDASSTLILSGTTAHTSPIGFSPSGNSLGTLTLNKNTGGVAASVNTSLTIVTALNLTQGQLSNSGISLSGGATLTRNSPGSITANSPGGGPYHLVYTGSGMTSGLEIPSAQLASLNVNVDNTAVFTLASNLDVQGSITLPSGRIFQSGVFTVSVGTLNSAGVFVAPSTTLTITSSFVNDGTFGGNNGTLVIAGSPVTMSGTALATTNFSSILINLGATLTAPSLINIQGDFTNNGTLTPGSGTVAFTGTVGSKVISGTTNTAFNNLTINKSNVGVSVSIGTTQTVNGTLLLSAGQLAIAGSNLLMGAASTITRNNTGSISGSSPGGSPWNLIYVGSSMSTGLEIPAGPVASFTISTNSATTLTLASALSVTGALTINSQAAGPSFTAGVNTISIGSLVNGGAFNAPSTTLTVSGDFTNNNTFTAGSGTVVFAGTTNLLGTNINATPLNNIIINAASTLVPNTTLTVSGSFTNNGTFTAGSGTVIFNGSVTTTLSGSSDSNFNNLTVSKGNGGLSLNVTTAQTATGTVTLTLGRLNNSGTSAFQMAPGSTLVRNSNGSITTSSPGSGPWSVTYTGTSMSTGLEIPTSGGTVQDLTVSTSNATIITLASNLVVLGTLSVPAGRVFTSGAFTISAATLSNAGTFSAPSTTLTITSSFVNDGAFGAGAGTVLISGGTVTMTGANIASTTFNNLTIAASSTLTAPTTLNISGSFQNDGTLSAGSGTVVFTGNVGSKSLSGLSNTQFNNLYINKTNAGVSVTVSSAHTVNGTLTLASGQLSITASALAMGTGATIIRGANGSIVGSSPSGQWNLIYVTSNMLSGLEIPAAGSLLSLTQNMNSNSTLTLTTDVSIINNLTISTQAVGPTFTPGAHHVSTGSLVNGGTFNAPTGAFNLTLTGNFTNNATFNAGTSTGAVVFNGASSLLGTNILTTNFHNVVINGSSSLDPGPTMNIQGNFTDNGTLQAGSGTIVFNGNIGSKTVSGSSNTQFNNVNVNKTNLGFSVTVSTTKTVTGTLTLTSGILGITSSALLMGSGTTLTRTSGGSILSSSPGGGPYNLVYTGASMNTGLEIPTGNLQTLSVSTNSATTVTLTSAANILGALTVNAQATGPTLTCGNFAVSTETLVNGGTFNAPTPATLTLTGNLTNNATFTAGSGTVSFNGTSSITGTVTFNHISITSAGTLNSPASLVLTGNFSNAGTFNRSTGTVLFNGSSTQNISGSASTTFNNITVNNAASPYGVRIEGTENLAGTLTLATGVRFDADGAADNGVFTVLSSGDEPVQDGRVALLDPTTVLDGQLTVQRYMGAEGNFNRYISSPVSNATVTGLADDFNTDGITTYDETEPGAASIGYEQIGSGPLVPGKGYLAYMWDGAANVTWDLRGPLTNSQNRGSVDMGVTHTSSGDPNSDGWNLVGNPYPSGIIWDNLSGWAKTDIAPIIYVPDVSNNVFMTWNAATQTGTLPNGVVTTGQAFWVYANQPGASLSVNEDAKTSASGTFYRQRGDVLITKGLDISVSRGQSADHAYLLIHSEGTAGYDVKLDGPKLEGPAFSVATIDPAGRRLVSNAMARMEDYPTVPIYFKGGAGEYRLTISDLNGFEDFETLYFVDTELRISLKISDLGSHEFTLSGEETLSDRFFLTRKPEMLMSELESGDFIAYPNPVSDRIHIEARVASVTDVSIFDEVGRKIGEVQMEKVGERRFQGAVEMGNCPPGMYLIRVISETGSLVKKIIKN